MPEPVLKPQDMITRVASALERHDLDELLSFYEPNAVLIRTDGSEAHGIDQIRTEYESYINKVAAMTGR
ncbi:MAG: nuclear transport factor 2 family protein, partial [Pseudomonadota bacterium]